MPNTTCRCVYMPKHECPCLAWMFRGCGTPVGGRSSLFEAVASALKPNNPNRNPNLAPAHISKHAEQAAVAAALNPSNSKSN